MASRVPPSGFSDWPPRFGPKACAATAFPHRPPRREAASLIRWQSAPRRDKAATPIFLLPFSEHRSSSPARAPPGRRRSNQRRVGLQSAWELLLLETRYFHKRNCGDFFAAAVGTREAFEVTSPRPCGERSKFVGHEFRLRGYLHEHDAWREPLTIADASHRRSSSKNGGRRPPTPLPASAFARRRASADKRAGRGRRESAAPHSRGTMRPSFAKRLRHQEIRGRRECRAPDAPAAARVV